MQRAAMGRVHAAGHHPATEQAGISATFSAMTVNNVGPNILTNILCLFQRPDISKAWQTWYGQAVDTQLTDSGEFSQNFFCLFPAGAVVANDARLHTVSRLVAHQVVNVTEKSANR